jgi:hypothetical protein
LNTNDPQPIKKYYGSNNKKPNVQHTADSSGVYEQNPNKVNQGNNYNKKINKVGSYFGYSPSMVPIEHNQRVFEHFTKYVKQYYIFYICIVQLNKIQFN